MGGTEGAQSEAGASQAPSELPVRDKQQTVGMGGGGLYPDRVESLRGREGSAEHRGMSGQSQPSPQLPHHTPSCLFPSLEPFLSPIILSGACPELLLPMLQLLH